MHTVTSAAPTGPTDKVSSARTIYKTVLNMLRQAVYLQPRVSSLVALIIISCIGDYQKLLSIVKVMFVNGSSFISCAPVREIEVISLYCNNDEGWSRDSSTY